MARAGEQEDRDVRPPPAQRREDANDDQGYKR